MFFALLLLQTVTPPIALACGGDGIAVREDVATVYGAQNSGNSAWPSVHAREATSFQGPIDVRIGGATGRIRLPHAMLPADTNGDGWFALDKLKLTDHAISGFAAINAMSRPEIHIDRGTGAIRVNGRSASYAGTCEAARS